MAKSKTEKVQDEAVRWEHYRSIPAKHWIEMSGRQAKTLIEQAERYGIPFGGAVVDLPAVVKALHDFFHDHGRHFAAVLARGDDELMAGGETSDEALRRYRMAKAADAEYELELKKKALMTRDTVFETLGGFCNSIKRSMQILERDFGKDAVDVVQQGLEEVMRAYDALAASQEERERVPVVDAEVENVSERFEK